MNNIGLYVEGRGGIAGQRLCPLSFGLQWQLHFDQDTASWREDAPHPIPLSTRLGIGDMEHVEIAEQELQSAARKAERMFTRKKFRKPVAKDRPYKKPSKTFSYKGVVDTCRVCNRPTAFGSRRCRECYQKEVRERHANAVREEDERVSANEAAFHKLRREQMKSKKQSTPITRSTSGLRETIFQEMEALRSGESTWQRARSMAMLANTVLDSVKTEVEYHKYVAATPKIVESDTVKRIGTDISLGQAAA